MSDYPADWPAIAARIKDEADNRCVRCGHASEGAWKQTGDLHQMSICGDSCDASYHREMEEQLRFDLKNEDNQNPGSVVRWFVRVPQRILTVHHLDGDKDNCEWWNLPALCQVCHLEIQGKVRMDQVWMFEHSEWFKIYVAGYLADKHLGRSPSREVVYENLDEMLALDSVSP